MNKFDGVGRTLLCGIQKKPVILKIQHEVEVSIENIERLRRTL